MSPASEELLMQYLDGELAPEGKAEAERLLEDSEEARAFLEQLEEVGQVVRAVGLERTAAAPDLTDAILSRVTAGVSSGAGEARVHFLRRAWAPLGAVALAAAAMAAVFLRPVPGVVPTPVQSASGAQVESLPQVAAYSAAPADAESEDEEEGAEIESVDFGARAGTIFMVASGPQVTPVVWLTDETLPSSKMAPL